MPGRLNMKTEVGQSQAPTKHFIRETGLWVVGCGFQWMGHAEGGGEEGPERGKGSRRG